MRRLFFKLFLLSIFHLLLSTPSFAVNTRDDWPMTAADPQRTSHNNVSVAGKLSVDWYRVIDPYIDPKVQVIAANNKIYVSTSKGLYAYDTNLNQIWVFATEMPLGNSPTIDTDTNILYVGGFDHRLYAIKDNGSTYTKFWEFEAGAGFETNPLVVNGVVYLGNRDGWFYALDASNGSLKWKYNVGSPIRFSAAYKNNIIYFGADDNVAYALNTDGTLKWKVTGLPGVGFSTYWPVVYNFEGKDYVIFSGSKKAAWLWFDWSSQHQLGNSMYFDENYYLSGCSGSGTLNCSSISNYFAGHLKKRNFFVFDAITGIEQTNPYAPVNWAGTTHGGNKYPPTVGINGDLYTFIGFLAGGNNGAHGWISGWKFGTSNITQIYNPESTGAADEPVSFTSGGNMIYYVKDRYGADGMGTIDISKPLGSNLVKWEGFNIPIKYTNTETYNGLFFNDNGVYDQNLGLVNYSPVPYNGKLYFIYGNTLVAMSPSGGNKNAGTSIISTNQQIQPISLTEADLRTRLELEISKIISAGHLRPGFYDSGIWSGGPAYMCDGPCVQGNHLNEYFTTPGETLAVLSQTLPYLSDALKDNLKIYLQKEQSDYPVQTYAHIGWKNGARREIYEDPKEMTDVISEGEDSSSLANRYLATVPRSIIVYPGLCCNTNIITIGSFPPDAFYGAWKYAVAQNFSSSQAKTLFDAIKNKLQKAGSGNNMTDTNLKLYPYVLNQYINGYRGYIELDKMANNLSDISKSSQYQEYTRLLSLRLEYFNKNSPWGSVDFNYNNALNVARNFMFLTPELAECFIDPKSVSCLGSNTQLGSKLSAVQEAIEEYQKLEPYWFVSKYDFVYGEGKAHPLYDHWALFQARAYILKQPFSELVKYIDVPAFERGDLFYIQNLVAALRAASSGPTPTPTPDLCPKSWQGDVNCDQFINIADLRLILTNLGGNGLSYDINKDSRVNIFDVGLILANFGK